MIVDCSLADDADVIEVSAFILCIPKDLFLSRFSEMCNEAGENPFPITIYMPCGEEKTYKTAKAFPQISEKCPCGKEGHWLVKYQFH